MPDYQTPHGAPEQSGGLYRAIIFASGLAHTVVVLGEDGAFTLVSGPTFYGWVPRGALILEAD